MTSRRRFLQTSLLSATALALPAGAATAQAKSAAGKAVGARVVSTWDFGVGANQAGVVVSEAMEGVIGHW